MSAYANDPRVEEIHDDVFGLLYLVRPGDGSQWSVSEQPTGLWQARLAVVHRGHRGDRDRPVCSSVGEAIAQLIGAPR